jgi:hypothetical protein
MRYRAAEGPLNSAWKHGCTLNMSASGVLIHIPEAMTVGMTLELAMDWTGLYHGREKMRLFLVASVTRSDRRGTALRILAHRFHGRETMRLFLVASVTRSDRRGTALRILAHRFRCMSPTRVRLRRAERRLAVA